MPQGSITAHIVVRSNTIGKLAALIAQRMPDIVDQAAVDLQTRASQFAPVDTGALRNSIYVNNGNASDYGQRVSIASGLNPDMTPLPMIDPQFVIPVSTSPGPNSYVTVVGVAAEYGLFQELGTRNNRAQPFMFPAALGVAGDFELAMSHIAD
jgi:hypothetical protein